MRRYAMCFGPRPSEARFASFPSVELDIFAFAEPAHPARFRRALRLDALKVLRGVLRRAKPTLLPTIR